MEVWKSVVDYEGKYEVSNHGRVKSLRRVHPLNGRIWHEQIMTLIIHTNKYQVISLYKGNKKRKFYVHRLVAVAFILNPESKDFVNHKDKDRLHNHVRNLEFMTHQENMDHRDNYQPVDNDEPF